MNEQIMQKVERETDSVAAMWAGVPDVFAGRAAQREQTGADPPQQPEQRAHPDPRDCSDLNT